MFRHPNNLKINSTTRVKTVSAALPALAVGLIALLLGDCATSPATLMNARYSKSLLASVNRHYRPTADDASIKLAESAAAVSHSLERLAAIEMADHPKSKLPAPESAERLDMVQLASVDWSGPIEPLVKKIAKASHYRLRVLGRRPAIPVMVSVSAKDIPLADILRDTRFQAEKQARIVIYRSSRTIELRYLHV